MKLFLKFVLIGVFVFLTKGLSATNYYVNDNSTVNDVYTSVVGNNANDGLTASTPFATLTYALTIVSPGDVIYVDAGTYYDRKLQLNIDNISIIGAGSSLVTFLASLNGTTSDIFFMNITGNNSFISGITADGYQYETGGNGKALTVQSNLTATIIDVSSINSDGQGGDGAFYIKSGATVTVKKSSSSCNSGVSTLTSGGFTVDGNGITLDIDSCLIADNYSGVTSNGAGIKIINGTDFTTVVTISNTSFANNQGGHGGAIFISGRSTLNVSRSCFNGNTANKPSGIAQGGAIAIGRNSDVTIDNCVFENNTSLVGLGSDGGAISIDTGLSGSGSSTTATLTITNSSFTNNSADDGGNHIYGNESFSRQASVVIDECTFDGVSNAISQRTDGEVDFLITNSGSPAMVNISSSLDAGSNTVAPSVIPDTYCPVQDGCSILNPCTDPGAPSGNANQEFCSSDSPTVADLVAVGSNIQWYDAATGGNLLSSNEVLIDGSHYYATQTSGTCESSTRLAVAVSILDNSIPTGNATQEFCLNDNALISDLSVSASGTITWYDQAVGGTVYSTGEALVDGTTYYAENTNGICTSVSRFAVTVSILDNSIPTGNATQEFCLNDNALISDLSVSASGTITWYDQAVGGTVYSTGEALVDGTTYYAENTNGTCTSTTRLSVTVNLNPTVSFSLPSLIHNENGNYILNGSPSGGWYSGNGIIGSTLDPSSVTLGKQTVVYNYTDNNGCLGSKTASTIIYDTTGTVCTSYDTTVVIETIYDTITINNYISVTDTLIIDISLAGLSAPNNINTMKVYPNPSNDVVNIDNGDYALMNGYSIKIININAQEVFNSIINSQIIQIPVSQLGATGNYFINIYDNNLLLIESKILVLQ